MSFLRPEAKAALWRWREVLAGGGFLCFGLWWIIRGHGWMIQTVGYAFALLALGLVLLGVQRARFRLGSNGPGVVQVVEGRVGYFGPLTGGVVDISEISKVALDRRMHPAHWVLVQTGVAQLHIPVTAKGAEALFDAFATLPGLNTEFMLRELNSDTASEALIWHKGNTAPSLD